MTLLAILVAVWLLVSIPVAYGAGRAARLRDRYKDVHPERATAPSQESVPVFNWDVK